MSAPPDIPFMDDRNTPRPAKKIQEAPASSPPEKKSSPKGGVTNGAKKSEEKPSGSPRSGSSARPGTASARAALVSAPTSKKKSPETGSKSASLVKPTPAYTPRHQSFRPQPRPAKKKAPEPPVASATTSSPSTKTKTAAKNTSPKKNPAPPAPARNGVKPPIKSFSVDPLDIAKNYPIQTPNKPSKSPKQVVSTNIAPPPLASPDVEFSAMNLEIGPDLSPTFSFDRQTNSGEKLITFKDNLNPRTDFDQLSRLLGDSLDDKEKQCMADLKQYLVKKEEAWILDQKLLNFLGGILEHRSLDSVIRVKVLRLLAAGALRDDFWSFLQLDRKDRVLMKFPNDFADLTVEEQKAIAIFLCNNFSSSKGAEWLLYGSPWKLDNNREISNVQITSKVAAFSLVSYTPSLQDCGSAIIYNIALKEAKGLSVPVAQYNEQGLPTLTLDYKEVTDKEIMSNGEEAGPGAHKFVTLKVYKDVAVELCMACLKYIKKTQNPEEEILYRCVKSLLKFSLILRADLLSCIAMVQCDLDTMVPGRSDRIDGIWSQLRQQLVNNSTAEAE